MKKELLPDLEMVACDVCGRTILKGERTEPYLVPDGSRRLVCDLCVRRAEGAGWLRESLYGGLPASAPRAEPRRSLIGRLRRRFEDGFGSQERQGGAAPNAHAGQEWREAPPTGAHGVSTEAGEAYEPVEAPGAEESYETAEPYEPPANEGAAQPYEPGGEPELGYDGKGDEAYHHGPNAYTADRQELGGTSPGELAVPGAEGDAAAPQAEDAPYGAGESLMEPGDAAAPPPPAARDPAEAGGPLEEIPAEDPPLEGSLLREPPPEEFVHESEHAAEHRAARRERRQRRRLRDPRHVRAVPTGAEAKMERALEIFNESPYRRTVGGLVRTLGQPWVTARPDEGSSSEVTVVVAWELSWYQFRVDLGDADEAVAVADKGHEIDEIDPDLRRWNATAGDDGALEPGMPRA